MNDYENKRLEAEKYGGNTFAVGFAKFKVLGISITSKFRKALYAFEWDLAAFVAGWYSPSTSVVIWKMFLVFNILSSL